MKRISIHTSVVVLVLLIAVVEESCGVTTSLTEKQLEKYGTRVGRDEYISVFKGPPIPGRETPRTFVLLSKLFVLPNSNPLNFNSADTAMNEITFPGGPLKFRHAYIPSASASASSSSTRPKVNINSNQEKIFFPTDEDETTKKTQYVYNKRPYNTDPVDTFPERRASYIFGPGRFDSLSPPSMTNLPPWISELERRRLNTYRENEQNTVLSSALPGSEDEDELGWYTLLTVPSRSKKASEECPPSHRRDHHGNCRPVFTFRGTRYPASKPSSLPITQTLAQKSAFVFLEEAVSVPKTAAPTTKPTTITTTTLRTTPSPTTIKPVQEDTTPNIMN